MSGTFAKIFGVVILLAVVFVAYEYMGEPSLQELSPEGFVTNLPPDSDTLRQEIFSMYEIVSPINLDTSIVSSKAFKSLVDITTTLPASAVGRPNPFSPTR